ncbi:uncharacterized protein BX663DRAFT_517077 [Cokeromyces recurvatus]|uniref:uncharacterized protein n=1 Tax=Cokeromyces recurvatus TaxID=90255 RepID=UPI00222062D2|nr:uncharacterized protein BX663DRAFT_517077 [Cokeromyces recurvatus]KAI7900630.1 hypothetical protein BX663DRAFT_517077 [Cokeromyces recurvatus]
MMQQMLEKMSEMNCKIIQQDQKITQLTSYLHQLQQARTTAASTEQAYCFYSFDFDFVS